MRQPVGAPRRATLAARYHITAPNPAAAQNMYNILTSRPLFAAGSARASAQPGRPAYGSSTGVKDDARVYLSNNSAEQWATKMIEVVKNSNAGDANYAQQQANRIGNPLPYAKWALQPNASGRRVLLRGMPRERPVNVVRDFITKDMGVEMEADGLTYVIS